MVEENHQPDWCKNNDCFPRKCANNFLCLRKLPNPKGKTVES